jgi:hypothetical protein
MARQHLVSVVESGLISPDRSTKLATIADGRARDDDAATHPAQPTETRYE